MTEVLQEVLRVQAEACHTMGSPLNVGLLERGADDLAAGGPLAELLSPWAAFPRRRLLDDAVALRWMAALHDMALTGEEPGLAQAYAAQDPDALWAAACEAMRRRADDIAAFMGHEPQTNEVGRSACLLPGFLEVARATGLPLRCFEIAASAGLNQSWDRYRYQLGARAWGDPAAKLVLEPEWHGPELGDVNVEVVERAACDRRPVDLADPTQRRRLLAYIWADQAKRLARIAAAIEVALEQGVKVEAADAADWTERRVAPRAGTATVLYHSIFWQYLSRDQQAQLTAVIEAIGGRATAEAPFAWLRMEPTDDLKTIEVRLTSWPGGDERLLATVHPHGAWVRWIG